MKSAPPLPSRRSGYCCRRPLREFVGPVWIGAVVSKALLFEDLRRLGPPQGVNDPNART